MSFLVAATIYFDLIFIDVFQKVQYKPGIYPLMNIQIKGYDYHVLESYQSFIDRSAKNIGLDVSERGEITY